MPDTTTTNGAAPPRPITDVLRDTAKGAALREASTQLRDVVAAVQATGKAGAVTVTVNVKPAKNADHLVVTATSRAKVPAFVPRDSVMFVDPNGDLTRHDPDQLALLGERDD